MVGIGVIGTGFGRIAHIPGFLAVQNATLVGVASDRYKEAKMVAQEFSLPHCFGSWEELIASPEIKGVSIATPPKFHEEIALAAISAGKAVFCEKPLALYAGQAKRMLEAARRAEVVHMVDFEFREIPAFKFAKEIIEQGELGPLRHINVNWIVHSWSEPRRPWSWRSVRNQGGGTLISFGVHVFDYIEWMVGPVRSVMAQLSTRITRRPDKDGLMKSVDADDCCQVVMELEDGTPVNISISTVATVGRGHWIGMYGAEKVLIIGSDNLTDYVKGFEVWEGEHGSMRFNKRSLPEGLELKRGFADGRAAVFSELAQAFTNAIIENNLSVRPSFEDGLRAQVLVDAARQANQEHRRVEVEPL